MFSLNIAVQAVIFRAYRFLRISFFGEKLSQAVNGKAFFSMRECNLHLQFASKLFKGVKIVFIP